ncbi:MAG: Cullin family protein [Amphiamblys sp. WSBS2006]|nr:MAG: Cullin family protein [Amphiamblys sp. WSBS2006]
MENKRNVNPFEIVRAEMHLGELRTHIKNTYFFYAGRSGDVVRGYELHRLCYELCICTPEPHTGRLYETVAKEVASCVFRAEKKIAGAHSYARAWKTYYAFARYTAEMLCYLTRTISASSLEEKTAPKINLPSGAALELPPMPVNLLAARLWKEIVLLPRVAGRNSLLEKTFEEIEAYRLGKHSSPGAFRAIAHSYAQCSLESGPAFYRENFENPLAAETEAFYRTRAGPVLESGLKTMRALFTRERNLGFLGETVFCACERGFFHDRDRIRERLARLMLAPEKKTLVDAYQTFRETQTGLRLFRETYGKCSEKTLRQSLERDGSCLEKIDSLIQTHLGLLEEARTLLFDDPAVLGALDSALENTLNAEDVVATLHPAKTVPRYLDSLLRNPREAPGRLESALGLFRKIHNKTAFRENYTALLATRLRTNPDVLREKYILRMFAEDIGSDYTIKLRAMCSDIEKNEDAKTPGDNRFSVLLLTKEMWPFEPTCAAHCPMALQRTEFETGYCATNTRRKIHWAPLEDTVEIELAGKDRIYSMRLTGRQWNVLSASDRGCAVGDRKTLDELMCVGLLRTEGGKILFNENFSHPEKELDLSLPDSLESANSR